MSIQDEICGGGSGKTWKIVSRSRSKRDRTTRGDTSQDSNMDNLQAKVKRAEFDKEVRFKVLIKVRGGSGFFSVSPLKLTKELKENIGDVIHATVLNNGMIKKKQALKIKKHPG